MSIDVDALKARTDIVAVVGSYTHLKKMGSEFCGPCPIHGGDGDNLYVNPQKRLWRCFSHGCDECDEGNDVIGFVRKIEGLNFKEACEFLGAKDDWKPTQVQVQQKAKPLPDRVTSKPPPGAGKPNMRINGLGEPSQVWEYKDAAGDPIGYVARYDTADGKEIRCWTWGARPDVNEPGWGCGHWSKPRPLYGLDRLAARSGAPVLVVEGEKAADAAQKLLGQMVVVTWPGGAAALKHADLEPLRGRSLLLWPDNDLPGLQCMGKLAETIADPRTYACKVRTLDPTGMADGFDAADWPGTATDLVTWSKPRIKEYVHDFDKQHPMPSDEPPLEAYEQDIERTAAPQQQEKKRKNGKAVLGEVFYRSMSEVESRAIDWLWPGRIAKGKVSMIVGNPGLGKSQVCASLTSIVSNGGSWPVDRIKCKQGSVVILSAEDDPEDTIRPRLEAAGANLDNVFILDAIRVERAEGDGKRGFDLTMDIGRLGALLYELEDAALVIIDPITAYLGDADSHKNAEVRALLAPLSEMASAQRVAVLAVSHLTKSSGMDALLRVQGSIGFAAAARAVWGVAKDKENPSRRLFMPLKNNLGTDENGFAYSVEGVRLPDSEIDTSHVMWENQLITQSAEDVFGGGDLNHEERGALFDGKLFLRGILANGPMDSKLVEADARGAGHSMSTLRRAAKEMNLRIAKDGFGKGAPWKWWPPET